MPGASAPGEVDQIAERYRAQGYPVTQQLARQIGDAAARFAIDPAVAFGLVRVESSFRNAATSSVGAVGLTQLMPRTAAWMEPGITRNELRDPETNLRVGFKYLRYLLDRYQGTENLALTAYNRGPGTVDKALDRGRNPDNGYAAFVRGESGHGHKLFTR
jgi:soluble lytic murein transglycosylase-like protein